MIVSLEGVGKSFGANLILRDITQKIEYNDRIGVVGLNGAGKSTLLSIINGDISSDTGAVYRNSSVNFGFLRQNSGLSEDGTIDSETRGVFSNLLDAESKLRALEKKLAETGETSPEYSAISSEYGALQTAFESGDGYLIDVKISIVLNGMGFGGTDRNTPVRVLSGGEKTRLALCKLLLENPGLLILDEPTNHLDFKTLIWLEEYLASYKGALLLVSHDRYFLDRLCGKIWEVFDNGVTAYNGNYTSFALQREERYERRLKEYEAQRVEIAEMKDFIARNIARASTTKQAQSRQKALDRMKIIEKPRIPPRPARIRFEYKREPVKDVLHIENLALSVSENGGNRVLFSGLDIDVMRGEKIALIGDNGIGKSSFLKAIQGKFKCDAGIIEWGRGVETSYFEQEELLLDPEKTALEELWGRFPRETEHRVRSALGHVQITGENIYKKVSALSGGERARIKFAILALSCGNVLLMDEPTNHLDLTAKDALDSALKEYTGTLVIVSHDRYLLDRFPTKIVEMHTGGLRIYKGNYSAYMEAKQNEAAAQIQYPEEKKQAVKNLYRDKKLRSEDAARRQRINELEQKAEALELEIWRLENEVVRIEVASDYLVYQEKYSELEENRVELSIVMSEWAELAEKVEKRSLES